MVEKSYPTNVKGWTYVKSTTSDKQKFELKLKVMFIEITQKDLKGESNSLG